MPVAQESTTVDVQDSTDVQQDAMEPGSVSVDQASDKVLEPGLREPAEDGNAADQVVAHDPAQLGQSQPEQGLQAAITTTERRFSEGSTANPAQDAPVSSIKVQETNGADEPAFASDLDVVRAEVLDGNGMGIAQASQEPINGRWDELQRLRDLVLASRGSKGQLPAGWDDERVDGTGPASEDAENLDGQSSGRDLLDRAIAKVGAEVSKSESEESEDSSESGSSSGSSGESDTESDDETGIKRAKPAPIVAAYDSEDDEDGGAARSGAGGRGPATKNEVIEPTIDTPPYSIVPDDKDVRPLGKVHSIVDNVVVVAQDTGMAPGAEIARSANRVPPPVDRQGRVGEQEGEYSVLDTGSLLAFDDRNVLGVVYETFGSVQAPMYALRYSSSSNINQDQIKVGRPVGYVPADSTYVLTRALRAMGKGSDASNIWDEEIGDDEQDFSDDEAEAAYKRNKKSNGVSGEAGASTSGKGKKRSMHDAFANGHATHGPGGASTIRHVLPPRPLGAVASPVHRDADTTPSRAMPLPYDDVDGQDTGATYQQSPTASQTQDAHAFQHIRPRGQPNTMRGRGRGRGRGAPSGHGGGGGGHPYDSRSGGAYNPAFGSAQMSWPGGRPFVQQQQQQQYGAAGSPAWNGYGGYGGYGMAQQSYDPMQHHGQQYQTAYPTASASGYGTYPIASGAAATSLAQNMAGQSPSASYDPSQPQVQLTPNVRQPWPGQSGENPAWQ